MTDTTLTPLQQKEQFGERVVAFLQSDVGIYLVKKATDEERDALEKLALVDAHDHNAIRTLQAQAWRANSVVGWLGEAVDEAVAAHQEMSGQEHLPQE